MSSYSTLKDEELATYFREGDRHAFAEIFERYNDLLYAHAYNKLRNKEEARDIVQDVFVRFWNKHAEIDIKSNLSGYLYIMVRNSIFSLISHKSVVNHYAASFNQFRYEGEAITDHLIREKQLSSIIAAEIAALPPRMREVFELSRKDNLSNRQIAERLGLSEFTVADQIKKALRVLRLRIGLVLVLAHHLLPYKDFF
jgi:RNA polymerase sigma-70 factor (ECF subfamily)